MKIKQLLDHPLMAPIVSPIKMVGVCATEMAADDFREIKWHINEEHRSHPSKTSYDHIIGGYQDYIFDYRNQLGKGLMVVGGLLGVIALLPLTVEVGAAAVIPGIIGGGAAGAVLGPVALPCMKAVGGAIMGICRAPFYFVEGLVKAAKHLANPSVYNDQQAVIRANQDRQAAQKAAAAAPPQAQPLATGFTVSGANLQEVVGKALSNMSAQDREKTFEVLKQKFPDAFAAAVKPETSAGTFEPFDKMVIKRKPQQPV